MNEQTILHIKSRNLPEELGNKAKNLRVLTAIRGISVPNTWFIPWNYYQRYLENPTAVAVELKSAIQSTLDPNMCYAVRSSSNIEDASFHSFAGLFKSILNVRGVENIKNAVIEVWQTVHSDSVRSYIEKLGLSVDMIHMGVIVQEMVSPIYSGVLFSNNPMTGISEVVLEVVPGEGTALVQDGVTPDRWVSRSGSWVLKPDESVISAQVAKKIVDESQKIRKKINKPIDLEWVFDGQDVFWVQMREITALQDLNIYSNRISKDVMPGMIHPLIWSINVPLINTVWLELLEEIVGKLPVEAKDLAKSFYFRSYFNMGAIGQVFSKIGLPSESLELLMGLVPGQDGKTAFKPNLKMLRLIPRLIGFVFEKWRFEKRLNNRLPKVAKQLQPFSTQPNPNLPLEQQTEEINQLFGALHEAVYFNVVTPLLTSLYSRIFENQLDKLGINFLEFNLYRDMDELDDYNPNAALAKLRKAYIALAPAEKASLEHIDSSFVISDIDDPAFQLAFKQFLKDFGHFSTNSNNFMVEPWRENPRAVLQMIREDQAALSDIKPRISFEDLPVRGLRKRFVQFYYRRARRFTLLREQVSKNYSYGYGLFRAYFLRLADALILKGWLQEREDIFYLTWEEIQQAIADDHAGAFQEKITERKQDMDAVQDVVLPEVIYGDDPPPVFTGTHDRMQGTPTSQGYYAGPVKVVRTLDDFPKVVSGDVIVIPYSDVGWTPLFARAGAVVAESGGLLSHSSIIAREYHIPAVVSVPNCMQLEDFKEVSVNGFTGEIVLLEETGVLTNRFDEEVLTSSPS